MFYIVLDRVESFVIVDKTMVDVHRNSDLTHLCGTVVIAKIDKIAPGLGLAFVSWNYAVDPETRYYGILSLLSWRGRGPNQTTNPEIGLQSGDYVLVQVIQEARYQKVSLVSGYISLRTSRMVAWPGESYKNFVSCFQHSDVNLQARGFLNSMLLADAICTGPQRWVKEQYELEHQWENMVLDLINQTNPSCSRPDSRGLEPYRSWLKRPLAPSFLVFDPSVRNDMSKWMIQNCPNRARQFEVVSFMGWKEWMSLHRAALWQPKIPLASGGTLIIESTEVGWNLDINSGLGLGMYAKRQANEDAIDAIAQQILVRNMQGLIFIDFISEPSVDTMTTNLKKLTYLLDEDSSSNRIRAMSQDGLVRIVRSRVLQANTQLTKNIN